MQSSLGRDPLFLARALLVAGALVSGGFGLLYTVRPEWLAGVVDIALPTASARADFRAIYGGAELGMALFFALAARRPAWVRPGLAALALIVGGFGAARLGSLALDAAPARGAAAVLWAVGATELASALLCAWALKRLNHAAPVA
ncbi:MAG: DUF4345 domain-containing protein [Gemmatimonadota bacterium]|nr:DUF4345 domain-containing protein [Gemmatimonadota bacterium]